MGKSSRRKKEKGEYNVKLWPTAFKFIENEHDETGVNRSDIASNIIIDYYENKNKKENSENEDIGIKTYDNLGQAYNDMKDKMFLRDLKDSIQELNKKLPNKDQQVNQIANDAIRKMALESRRDRYGTP